MILLMMIITVESRERIVIILSVYNIIHMNYKIETYCSLKNIAIFYYLLYEKKKKKTSVGTTSNDI